jgi:hypothetical protein
VAAPETTLRTLVALRKWQVDWAPSAFNTCRAFQGLD